MQEKINHHKGERDNVPWIPKEGKNSNTLAGK